MTIYLQALCGTCDHQHDGAGCHTCDCAGWTPHPDTDADNTERELQEMTAFDGRLPLIDTATSGGLVQVLTRFEADAQHLEQVSGVPCLAAITLDDDTAMPGDAIETIFSLNILSLPAAFWTAIDTDALIAVGEQWVAEQYELPEASPTVAWALATRCTAHLDGPEMPARKAHVVAATDIDGRMYTVVHTLDDDQGQWDIRVAPGWAQLLHGDIDLGTPETSARIEADNITEAHKVTAHLITITRYATARIAAADALTPKEKP